MEQILSVLLLSLSANLDTFLIAVSYSLNNIKISFNNSLVITLITTIGTYFSIRLGQLFSSFMPKYLPNILGGITLLIMGIWVIVDYEIKLKSYKNDSLKKYTKNGIKEIRKINLKEAIFLALALMINNVGIGIAAGIADINIIYSTVFTFIVTFLSINLGSFAGKGIISKIMGRYSTVISGFLLIILGIYELLN